MAAAKDISLRIGIELELLLKPRDDKMGLLPIPANGGRGSCPRAASHDCICIFYLPTAADARLAAEGKSPATMARSRAAMRCRVAALLSTAGIPTTTEDDPEHRTFMFWVAGKEHLQSAERALKNQFYGVELKSRTISLSDPRLRTEIKTVWDVLHTYFIVKAPLNCGTHIHVSLARMSGNSTPLPWTPMDVANLAFLTVLFERAVQAIMPLVRQHSRFAKSHLLTRKQTDRDHPLRLALDDRENHGGSWSGVFDVLRTQATAGGSSNDKRGLTALANLMCPGDKNWAWNFRHLSTDTAKGALGTVEFRLPPGCESAGDTLHWVAFTCCLVRFALARNFAAFLAKDWQDLDGETAARPDGHFGPVALSRALSKGLEIFEGTPAEANLKDAINFGLIDGDKAPSGLTWVEVQSELLVEIENGAVPFTGMAIEELLWTETGVGAESETDDDSESD